MRALAKAAVVASIACSLAAEGAGCVSYDDLGPKFAPSPAPDAGYALVYVYREKDAWGALYGYTVSSGDRSLVLMTGHYVVMMVPEGKSDLLGSGGLVIPVEATRDRPAFVRVEMDKLKDSWAINPEPLWKVDVVDPARASKDLEGIPLAPGGRARYPDTPVGEMAEGGKQSERARPNPPNPSPPSPPPPPAPKTSFDAGVLGENIIALEIGAAKLGRLCPASSAKCEKLADGAKTIDELEKARAVIDGMALPKDVASAWAAVNRTLTSLGAQAEAKAVDSAPITNLEKDLAKLDAAWRARRKESR